LRVWRAARAMGKRVSLIAHARVIVRERESTSCM
jgi:hypothetical protein